MNRYFSKRYFLFFLLFFLIWYPGSFLIVIGYASTQNGILNVASNVYFPLSIFIFSFLYFRKSPNDWNDRLFVAFGWILLSILFAALLVKPMYGVDWTSIVNIPQLATNWSPFLLVLVAGILSAMIGNKK